ncbi:MAG TPA: FtsX-like permease family protein [Candidatus Saccharimonadales bacterium]|nr:FtsX-like permease family protein [Candidatus Saccharimonadales bacterium]
MVRRRDRNACPEAIGIEDITPPDDRADSGNPGEPRDGPSRFGYVAFVRQRAGADRAILLAVWLVLLTATTFASATVLYADAVARSGLTRLLLDAGPEIAHLGVTTTTGAEEVAEPIADVEASLAAVLAGTAPDVLRTSTMTGSFALPGGTAATPDLTVVTAAPSLEARATVVEGRWPQPGGTPIETILTAPAAAELGVTIGEEMDVRSRVDAGRLLGTTVVGIIAIDDPTDPIWADERLLADGTQQGASFRLVGPLIVAEPDLVRTGEPRVELAWTARPDLALVDPATLDGLRARLAGLSATLEDRLGGPRASTLTTVLPDVLETASRSLLVGGTGILILNVQLAIIAAYALVLVAALLRAWRGPETALLRARGAGAEHLVRLTVVEAIALVASASVAGPVLAWLGLQALGIVEPLGPGSMPAPGAWPPVVSLVAIMAAVVGIAGLIGLTLPTLASDGPLSAVRRSVGRGVQLSAAHRSGLDLALVAIAGVALWQLRAYGAPLTTSVRGSIGVDPLLVAAPAIGLAAGAVLAMRVIPWAARRLAVIFDGRSSLVGWLGSRQLARRPLRYTAPALLLVVATGIGVFSVAYATTWAGSQEDQVGHALGADAVLSIEPRSAPPTWIQERTVALQPGVEARTPVLHSDFDLGGGAGRGELLAVDAEAVATVVRLREDLAATPPLALAAALAAARPVVDLPPLPSRTTMLALDVTSDLVATREDGSSATVPDSWRGIRPIVVVRDANGRLARFEGTTGAIVLGRARVDLSLAAPPELDAVIPLEPLELVSVEVDVRMPPGLTATGSLRIDGLVASEAIAAASPAELGAAGAAWPAGWTPVDTGFAARPWVPVRIDPSADPRLLPVDPGDPARLTIPPNDPLEDPSGARFALRPAAVGPAADLPIPALIDRRLAAATGAAAGSHLSIGERFRDPWALRVVDVVELVPATDPAQPAAIADLATMELSDFALHDQVATTTAWWLSAPGSTLDGLRAMSPTRTLPGLEVTLALDELDARLRDPVVQGVGGGLLASAAAAAVFALIGLVVSVSVAARERRGEFAVLRALGSSRRQLDASLAMEAGFVIACGILAGLVVAGLLAWIVLPSVSLTVGSGPVVPAVRVDVPLVTILPVLLGGLALWAILVAASRSQVHPERAAETLREAEA